MPGMTATVSIEVARRDNVLRAPLLAFRFTPPDEDGAGETARPANDGRPGRPRREEGDRSRRDQGQKERRPMASARLWILDGGRPKPVSIMRGVQNSRYAEIGGDVLKEGDEVIVGLVGVAAQASPQGQNPLMPRMPGGGGGRRGGF
jgi:HlyD family secretion protein